MKRNNIITFNLFLCFLLVGTKTKSNTTDLPIKEIIQVETTLPAYVNSKTATLIIKSLIDRNIDLIVSFEEQHNKAVPSKPITIKVESRKNIKYDIDISSWKDGEYKVKLYLKNQPGNYLIRGIRKQTILNNTFKPTEPLQIAGQNLILVDDFYISEKQGLTFKNHKAELIKISPHEQYPELKRYRHSIQKFSVDNQGNFNISMLSQNYMGDPHPLRYNVVTKDFLNWIKESHNPAQKSGNQFRDKVIPQYKFYDPKADGEINLKQVSIDKTGLGKDSVMWGNIKLPRRSMYAVWNKSTKEKIILQKEPITQDKSIFTDEEIGEWSNTNDNFGKERLYNDGKILRFYQSRLIPLHDPLRVHYDNVLTTRVMVIWSSTDGLRWEPTYFNAPGSDEASGRQDYGVDIFEAGNNLEIGYHRVYDQKLQRLNTELVYSRDGLFWNRIGDGLFMDNGEFGSWNFGYSMTTGNRTRVEHDGYYYEPMMGINVLHFMFLLSNNVKDRNTTINLNRFQRFLGGRLFGANGFESSSTWPFYGSWDNVINQTKEQIITAGLMKYRKDGWVSLGTPKLQGAFVTKELIAGERQLSINAKTEKDGFIMIEVLDKEGNDLPDYCKNNASWFSGNSVHQEISWKNGDLKKLPSGSFKLRVTVSKGELFSLQF